MESFNFHPLKKFKADNEKNTSASSYLEERSYAMNEIRSKNFVSYKSHGNPEVYSDECDSYFENALLTFKQGLDDEQKGIFVQNVLEQTIGQELNLSCQSVSSHCIELLLEEYNDLPVLVRFMEALALSKEDACGNRFASHITENLLYYGLYHLQNWNVDIQPASENEDAQEKAKYLTAVLSWIHSFGEFCLENFETCLQDEYASHVLRTLIQVLGGYYVGHSSLNRGKRAREQKRHFENEYLGSNFSSKEKDSIILKEIPKFFVTILKKMSKTFLQLENIEKYAVAPQTAPVVQSFLLVLKKRLPKRSKKFVKAIIQVSFKRKTKKGIPIALIHKNGSYVVEKLFEAALEDQQEDLWKEHIAIHIKHMVLHGVGNYIVQRLFDVVASKNLFETMCESVMELFPAISNAYNFGIFVSMASACIRLGWQQAQFIENLMKCLNCHDSEDKQLLFIPLLLGLKVNYDQFMQKSFTPGCNFTVTLQGSLVAQSVLKFHKPIKAVRSILNMKPEHLKYLACHVQGCHVLTAFLESSSVGEKNKDNFLYLLQPVMSCIASDRNGSLTLSRMWVLLSLKQKGIIANNMVKIERQLCDNQNVILLLRKFGIFYFKKSYDQWKEFQKGITKKRTFI